MHLYNSKLKTLEYKSIREYNLSTIHPEYTIYAQAHIQAQYANRLDHNSTVMRLKSLSMALYLWEINHPTNPENGLTKIVVCMLRIG